MTLASEEVSGQSLASPRWTVFVHQEGLVLCATVRALSETGVLEPSLSREASLAELQPELTPSGFGYQRVGLRSLASQGWLAAEPTLEPETSVLRWTSAGRAALRYRDSYVRVGEFLAGFRSGASETWSSAWSATQIESFLSLLPLACDRWRLGPELPDLQRALTTTHLDAGLAVPAMLWLQAAGMLSADGPALPSSDVGRGIRALLTALGWIDRDSALWTDGGRQAAAFAVHFGMAASYLPLLARLPDLYRGELLVTAEPGSACGEWHVHRGLNISASAAAHRRYFGDADSVFREVFDRGPVEAQPRFVADMGCGDGSWLVHIYELVRECTLRGRRADDPLLMVGLDYNAAALEEARRVLDSAGVPALLLHGDVSNPDEVAPTLAEQGLAMTDGLHVRAFIDHDRRYVGGDPAVEVRGGSSGAYVDGRGRPISSADVERDLVAHLRRWAPHVKKHGLVVLEAHSVAPRVARKHLGATHSVAFDAYHGYSHQYPIEHYAYRRCCRQAGLRPASHHERRYPATRPFVAVSLNRLQVPGPAPPLPAQDGGSHREDTWQPEPGVDLEDGRALHELLFDRGDIRFPRQWCSAATGFVVARAVEVVEARLAVARRGDVIRVLDYGAGTGLAAIELLKAYRDRGVERRLEDVGATLELHLVDLPSSWFAQGFELLGNRACTRFHSLRGANGSFRPLPEVTGGRRMDVVMSNMVFHLIPPTALQGVAADLARVVKPLGRLVWSSPDLGPAGPFAVLFHDANRALRKRWIELLSKEPVPDLGPRLREGVLQVREGADAAVLREAQRRADRRVLPHPHTAVDVAAAVGSHFGGEIERPTHEILTSELLDTLLVPSNQEEFLSEIAGRGPREDVIRELMLNEVVPAMQEEAAGTSAGVNVQWTLGTHDKPAP